MLLLDTLVPIVGYLGINETGIQIQETDQMHFEGLQFLIGQVLPKYVKIKFDPKTKQNSDHEDVVINYGLYDAVQSYPHRQFINILFDQLRIVYKKRLAGCFWVLEFITYDSRSYYVVFENAKECDKLFYTQFFQQALDKYENKIFVCPIDSVSSSQQIKSGLKLYKQGQLSTYGLLMLINYLAERSFQDLF